MGLSRAGDLSGASLALWAHTCELCTMKRPRGPRVIGWALEENWGLRVCAPSAPVIPLPSHSPALKQHLALGHMTLGQLQRPGWASLPFLWFFYKYIHSSSPVPGWSVTSWLVNIRLQPGAMHRAYFLTASPSGGLGVPLPNDKPCGIMGWISTLNNLT